MVAYHKYRSLILHYIIRLSIQVTIFIIVSNNQKVLMKYAKYNRSQMD